MRRLTGTILALALAACTAGGGPTAPTSPAGTTPAGGSLPTVRAENDGTITGRVSYPADFRPDLDVYAIYVNDPDRWYAVRVSGTDGPVGDAEPNPEYTLQVAPGTYYVLAYPAPEGDMAGLYSEAVPCGLTAACNDHTLIPVTVRSGETVSGIDPTDWYYQPETTYPPRPE